MEEYIELDWQNAGTFSNEYALLLQSIGAELDNFFKVYCGFLAGTIYIPSNSVSSLCGN